MADDVGVDDHAGSASRPTGTEPKYRYQTIESLARDQRVWDTLERMRQAHDAVRRDDVAEEPSSKALENRARVAFLARKGATMAEWLTQRDAILARLTAGRAT